MGFIIHVGAVLNAQSPGLNLLEDIESKLINADALSVKLRLEVFIPNNPTHTIDGTFYKSGEKYFLSSSEIDKISDGTTVWSIDKTQDIAYITSAQDKASVSPLELIQQYDKSAYIYTIVPEYSSEGKTYKAVVLKPKDRNADYTKVRFLIDKQGNLKQFFLLSRNGMRRVLTINSIKYSLPEFLPTFSFNKADYPGIKVEDLRL